MLIFSGIVLMAFLMQVALLCIKLRSSFVYLGSLHLCNCLDMIVSSLLCNRGYFSLTACVQIGIIFMIDLDNLFPRLT